MKKLTVLFAALCVMLMITATSQPVRSAEQVNLRFSIDYPEQSSLYRLLIKPILDDMEAKGNGRIKITRYLGGILGKGPELYEMVKTGKVDFTSHATGYTPGRFPMCDVLSLPGAYENSVISQEVAPAVYDRILNKEFPDTHSLSLHQAQLFYIYTVNKPIKVMEDVKGLKIRTSGGHVTDALKALGAAPVLISLGDVYTSLQTGVIDGVVLGPSAFPGFKLQEVLKYCTRFKFGTTVHVFTVNQKTWEKIPGDLGKVMEDVVRNDWASLQIAMFQKDDAFVTNFLTGKGGSSYTLAPAEEARWIEALKPVVNQWVVGLKAKGLPADDLMTVVREETSKRKIPFPY